MNSKPHLSPHCILGSVSLNPGLAFMIFCMALYWEKLVDAHSKWLEAVVVSSTSQQAILHMLRRITSAPYHPTTNGLAEAEQAMQTVKNALRKTSGDIDSLFLYRITPPPPTTGKSPAELFLGQNPVSLGFRFPIYGTACDSKQRKTES